MVQLTRDEISVVYSAKDRYSQTVAAINKNTSGMISTVRRAQDQLNRGFGGRQAVAGLRNISREVATITGLTAGLGGAGVTGVLGGLTAQGFLAGESLGKVALRLGAVSEELGRVRFLVSQTSDISESGLNTSLQRMRRRLSEVSQGYGTASRAIEELNLNAEDLIGSGLENQFLTIAEAINGVKDAEDRLRLTTLFFDSEGAALNTTFSKSREELTALADEADRLGITFAGYKLDRIQEANDSFGKSRDLLQAIGIESASRTAPALQSLTDNFNDWVEAVGGAQAVVNRTFDDVDARIRQAQILAARSALFTRQAQEVLNPASGAAGRAREEFLERDANRIRAIITELQIPDIRVPLTSDAAELQSQIDGYRSAIESAQNAARNATGEALTQARRTIDVNLQALITAKDRLENLNRELAGQAANTANTPAPVINEASRAAIDQAAQREALTRETAAREVQALRESFDQRLKIEGDYNRAVARLREQSRLAGTSPAEIVELESQLENRLREQLDAYEARQEAERKRVAEALARQNADDVRRLVEAAEQARQAADLSRLVGLDLSRGIDAQQLNRIANQERIQIQAAVSLPPEERQQLLAEVERLRSEGEARLQINAVIREQREAFSQGLSQTQTVLGALGDINDASRNTDIEDANARAQELQGIQQDYNAAVESGNAAEIASAQARYNRLNAIQQRELQAARRRFKQHKNIQIGIGVASTISAAVQVLEETKGGSFARFAAMASVLAAGYKQVDAIRSLQFESPTAGTGGVGGFAGGTNPSQESITQSSINDSAAGPTEINFYVQGGLNDDFVVEDLMNRISTFSKNGGTKFSAQVIAD